MTAASRPFYQLADRILGSQFLQDIAEFFILFQTMHDGFVDRARSVQRLLADSRTTFVVVTTLEPSPLREAEFFVDALHDRRLNLGAVVMNKVLPDYLRDPGVARTATAMSATAETLAKTLAPAVAGDPTDVARLLQDVAASFHDYALAASRQAEQRAELSTAPDALVAVPQLGSDLTDLTSVLELGRATCGVGGGGLALRGESTTVRARSCESGYHGDHGCSGRRKQHRSEGGNRCPGYARTSARRTRSTRSPKT